MLLGAHESIAGGLPRAIERAEAHGCEAVQVFVKNARGWAARPIDEGEASAFRKAARASPVLDTMAHASYLINLGAEPGQLRDRSLASLADELSRCQRLDIPGLVVHPGGHADRVRGLGLAAEGIAEVLARTPGTSRLWLENTAGQGTTLGSRFEELGVLLQTVKSDRLGICFDTCHAFAAGYDISTEAGYTRTMKDLGEAIGGLSQLRAFHLNDSQGPLGCRLDRHAEIGEGSIGLGAFRLLVRDPRFARIPGVLETDSDRYPAGLERLRSLA